MQLYIEGYRTQNKKLVETLTDAAYWYCAKLLGPRMVNSKKLILDIKLTKNLSRRKMLMAFVILLETLGVLENFVLS